MTTASCAAVIVNCVITDFNNKRVKLLNHHYQVVGHCDLTASPEDMCQITSSEVAIAVDMKKTHEVLFVSVNGVRLVKDRKLTFQHRCYGIAFNQKYNQLYLTTGTALYNYSISGVLLKKLYEDIAGDYTVSRCAVSPLGDKIFVLNIRQGQVLTLAKDGTPLYTFTDTDLHNTRGIHVTPQGQVLVCGGVSKTMLQLDGGCTKKLATLATKDDLNFPVSVFYNRSTTSIIVGQLDSNTLSTKILVFKVT
ncbi:uncharacterized protein LOC127856280 isoform X2 [Dreissena polymorpha]|uniref:uncharacterized protein LOC127856280 isoform X2 n=1 Tax=Dreissena polymorpha TaxID=45954 RepID=UPI0022655B07|nr:uncharacterized protein LOC127856280 isoform X2 [Dreissena polymorpha]